MGRGFMVSRLHPLLRRFPEKSRAIRNDRRFAVENQAPAFADSIHGIFTRMIHESLVASLMLRCSKSFMKTTVLPVKIKISGRKIGLF